MAKMIFVNLPVGDLARSTAFYQAIGGSFGDPDGHHWEVMWMDVAAAQSATADA